MKEKSIFQRKIESRLAYKGITKSEFTNEIKMSKPTLLNRLYYPENIRLKEIIQFKNKLDYPTIISFLKDTGCFEMDDLNSEK